MSEEEVQGKHLGAKVPLQHARQGSVRSGWIVTTSDSYFFFVDHGKDEENVWPNPVCGAQEPDDG